MQADSLLTEPPGKSWLIVKPELRLKSAFENSLVIQWLGFSAFIAVGLMGPSSIPGQRTSTPGLQVAKTKTTEKG